MNAWFWILIAFLAGSLIPIQGTINGRLGSLLEAPMIATCISFLGGLLAALLVLAVQRPAWPTAEKWGEIPWYLYTGGLYGAIFVTVVLISVRHVGIASVLSAAITGQLLVSMVLDHHGAFSGPVRAFSADRLIGVLLLLAGVWMIQKPGE